MSRCRWASSWSLPQRYAAGLLERLGVGHAVEALIADSQGRLCREATAEATVLAAKALARQMPSRAGAA